MYSEILEKYNSLPRNKQKDVENFIFTIYESEQKQQLRNEIESRRAEIKTGNKVSSDDFWEINEL
jgi:hypothetical protein